jgi:hypothetical protein
MQARAAAHPPAKKDELLRMGRLQAKREREDEWLRVYEEKVKMHKDFAFAFSALKVKQVMHNFL